MIKTTIEQVTLVNQVLKKTPDGTPPEAPQPAVDMSEARKANSKKLTDLFGKMNEHSAAGRVGPAGEIKGQIKDLALKAPKGSIDVGHMGIMREHQLQSGNTRKPLSHEDMEEVINHHLSDAKSLKDIHQNHGGDDTIRTLMHTMGANGNPKQYSNLKFNKPGLHEDLLDLVWGNKADHDRSTQRHKGVMPQAPFAKTPYDPDLNAKVQKTGEALMGGGGDEEYGLDNKTITKAHEKAVVDRGLELLRRHHGLYDKVADLKSGGSVHYNTKGNYTVKHPQGDMHVWHDDKGNHSSYNQHKDENEDGSGFDEAIAASKPIQDHVDEAIAAIKEHRKKARY